MTELDREHADARDTSQTESVIVRVRVPADALAIAPYASGAAARAAFDDSLANVDVDAATRKAAADQLVLLHEKATAGGALACGVLNGPYADAWAMWTYAVHVLPRPDSGSLDPIGLVSRMLAHELPAESAVIERVEAAGRPAVGVRAYTPLRAGPDAAEPFAGKTLTIATAAVLLLPDEWPCAVLAAATALDPRHLDEITALVCLIAQSATFEAA